MSSIFYIVFFSEHPAKSPTFETIFPTIDEANDYIERNKYRGNGYVKNNKDFDLELSFFDKFVYLKDDVWDKQEYTSNLQTMKKDQKEIYNAFDLIYKGIEDYWKEKERLTNYFSKLTKIDS